MLFLNLNIINYRVVQISIHLSLEFIITTLFAALDLFTIEKIK